MALHKPTKLKRILTVDLPNGGLSLRAVDLFNENAATVHALVLKPCCLPPMMHARREEIFAVGAHRFAAADVPRDAEEIRRWLQDRWLDVDAFAAER